MFIKSLLQMLLILATDLLNKKKNTKIVKWFVSQEVQNTVGTFFAAYTTVVLEHEENEEDEAE